MTWSYSGNPAASPKDEVRFLVGDTDTTEQLVQDEEIAYELAIQTNAQLAAANIAEAIGAKFARKADTRLGDYSVSYSNLSKSYFTLAAQLRSSTKYNAALSAIPYGGGISISDMTINEDDTDIVQPKFKVGMQEIEGEEELS